MTGLAAALILQERIPISPATNYDDLTIAGLWVISPPSLINGREWLENKGGGEADEYSYHTRLHCSLASSGCVADISLASVTEDKIN